MRCGLWHQGFVEGIEIDKHYETETFLTKPLDEIRKLIALFQIQAVIQHLANTCLGIYYGLGMTYKYLKIYQYYYCESIENISQRFCTNLPNLIVSGVAFYTILCHYLSFFR